MLSDKVIIVTGASGRLGRRIVDRFAADGAAVGAVVRTEEDAQNLQLPETGDVRTFPVDLTDESRVAECFDKIATRFRRIDALVHAVGMWEARPIVDTTLDDWNRMIRVNLTTTFLCIREAVRLMDGPGRLIAFTSRQGADGGTANQAGYAAAKAGIIRLIEAAADEYRDRGITAHAIAPSMIRYDDEGNGVRADDLIDLCRTIIADTGDAVNGATLRAYGNG